MAAQELERLLFIMRTLRDPQQGCPWDIKQTFASIAPYTIEEAYEVADAIERGDYDDLQEELGDLLLQVIFHAQMADEADLFDFHAVAKTLGDKLVARHPHVFGAATAHSADEVRQQWEARKADERSEKNQHSLLDDIPHNMPALMRAQKLQKRVAQVGFDWAEIAPVIAKVREELQEVEAEIAAADAQQQAEELGDLLFVVVNLARHLGFKAEDCLREANHKFERRFRGVEAQLAERQLSVSDCSLQQLDAIWDEVKRAEAAARQTETKGSAD